MPQRGRAKVKVGKRLAAIHGCGAFEQRQREIDVSIAQRGQPHDVEGLDVVRFALEHAAERDLGLFGLALLEQ